MRVFESIAELAAAVGETVGPGEPFLVTQERIDTFADATDDHQWIHVDPERAATGPFGGTIAHGFLSLSLLVPLVHELIRVDRVRMGINYGLNKVRFPAPLPVGATVRATVRIASVEPVGEAWQIVLEVTVVADGSTRPCVVAEWVTRRYPEL